MEWQKISDTEETSGDYMIARYNGFWLAFAPDQSAPIFTSDEPTFTSNTAESDREVARAACESHAQNEEGT